tara:strand:- start:560 stop:727 length:168 start_codon:yes stop_codon:yes gene_type:complete
MIKFVNKIRKKLLRTQVKILSAHARKKLKHAYDLEDKAIWLELELREIEKQEKHT